MDKYLLLTELKVRTAHVSYGPSVFSHPLMVQARSARAIKKQEKKRIRRTYSTYRENEVSKIFIISLKLLGRAGNETFKVSEPYSKVRPAK